MKEPKEIALKWCELLQNMQLLDRVEVAFTLIKEKDNLELPEFRQLSGCGIPVVDSLKGLCRKEVSEIASWIKAGSIGYDLLTDALEKKYNNLTNKD